MEVILFLEMHPTLLLRPAVVVVLEEVMYHPILILQQVLVVLGVGVAEGLTQAERVILQMLAPHKVRRVGIGGQQQEVVVVAQAHKAEMVVHHPPQEVGVKEALAPHQLSQERRLLMLAAVEVV